MSLTIYVTTKDRSLIVYKVEVPRHLAAIGLKNIR